jgi:hypothetical protein
MAVVVAGMHRSGTSVCTDVLSLLDVTLPSGLIPSDRHNTNGYFEAGSIVALNERLLRAAGSSWMDCRKLCENWCDDVVCSVLVRRLRSALRREFRDAPAVLIKDPRIARMCPLWNLLLADLGFSTCFVLPFRNPTAVVTSLRSRSGLDPRSGYLLWLRHVLDAEHATRDRPRAFVAYQTLLTRPEAFLLQAMSRLELRTPLPIGTLLNSVKQKVRPDLQHADGAEFAAGHAVPAIVQRAFESYHRLEDDPHDAVACATLDRLAADADALTGRVWRT